MDIFEEAVRKKVRFNNPNPRAGGLLSTEDLWDLNVPHLIAIATDLNKKVKEAAGLDFLNELDFVNETSESNELEKLKFDVVISVLKTKKKEQNARKEASSTKKELEEVLAAIDRKQKEKLETLSLEELQAKAKSFQDSLKVKV